MKIAPEIQVRLFREMLRIRKVQVKIESLYPLDEMKTPVHLCIGQEAMAAGVCAHLARGDFISSASRCGLSGQGGDLNR
jgi:pyruvate dehydrogenase E1 component alpha subunit